MNTPVTDAAFNAANLHTDKRLKKIYETCQKLELERNQAIAVRNELAKTIVEARLQLEYLHEKQPRGTTISVIGKIDAALEKL